MRTLAMVLAAAASVTLAATDPADEPDRGFDIERLADGVYAVIRHDAGTVLPPANNVFIINGEDVMVVDTNQSPAATREVAAALRTITRKPVRYVINTNADDEHSLGNEVYRRLYEEVEFIGHVAAAAMPRSARVEARGRRLSDLAGDMSRLRAALAADPTAAGAPLGPEDRQAYQRDLAWIDAYVGEAADAMQTGPTLPIHTRLTLQRGRRTIEVFAIGPARGATDLLVYLPAERVAIAGDLVTWPLPIPGERPSIEGWIQALDALRALGPVAIVPGHGPVLRDLSYVADVRGLLADIAAHGTGPAADDVLPHTWLTSWRTRFAGDSVLRGQQFDRAVDVAFGRRSGSPSR